MPKFRKKPVARHIGLAVLLALPFLAGCSDEPTARRVLAAQGFRAIEITGYRALGCARDDVFHTGFKATSVNGATVTGVVCADASKNPTVRID